MIKSLIKTRKTPFSKNQISKMNILQLISGLDRRGLLVITDDLKLYDNTYDGVEYQWYLYMRFDRLYEIIRVCYSDYFVVPGKQMILKELADCDAIRIHTANNGRVYHTVHLISSLRPDIRNLRFVAISLLKIRMQ